MVSVLVPVYNVEKYISKCLDSILNQTYTDLEIILVNDGSKDSSLAIANLYAEKYPCIHIYSYENSGISATRNRLLSLAHGEYILFVDSDDYISKNMIETMVNASIQENSDIVICGYYLDTLGISIPVSSFRHKTVSSLEALHLLCSNRSLNNYPWAKLVRRSCFQNVAFPEDKRGFEDTYTMFKAFIQASNITILPHCFYHYVKRKGSLTDHMSLKDVYDMRNAFMYQYEYLSHYYPQESFSCDLNYYNSDMFLLYLMIFYCKKNEQPIYDPAYIDWSNLNVFLHIGYKIWYTIAKLKFGWER